MTIHNSKCIMHNWLRCLALLSFFTLHFSLFINPALAQDENAAFYIYQNDGHFDGFFYDQVQKITYSRVDTAGIEWDDYVSQEIVTEDSTYRIMLSAIDSVGFVQPEIKYNPEVRMMDDEGLTNYIVSADGQQLILRGNTPEPLRPKEGQVLACPRVPGSGTPFVGKVIMSYELDGNLYVLCSKLTKLGELFEQFISVEEVVTDDVGAMMRHRLAGAHPRRAEGNWNGDLFQFNADMEDSYQLSDKWKALINLHAGFGMKAQVVYNITPLKFFLKMSLQERVEMGMRSSIDGTIGEADNILEKGVLAKALTTLSRLHLPANFPIMYLDAAPKPFIRGDAHFNVGVTIGATSKFLHQWFMISSEHPYFDGDLLARDLKDWAAPSFSVTAELNGMLQMGMKMPFKISTEDYFSDLIEVSIGNTIYIGPKLTASLSMDVLKTLTGQGIYEGFKNTKLTLYPFCYDNEMKFEGKFFLGNPKERKYTFNKSIGAIEFGAFPEFSNVEYEITGDNQRTIHARMNVNGEVFAPQRIGFGLYDKEGKLLRWNQRNETYLINTFNDVDVEFKNLEPGTYTVRPVTWLFNALEVPIYSEEKKLSIDALQMTVSPSEVTFEAEEGTEIVTIETAVGGPLSCSTFQDWIHPTTSSLYKTMEVKVDANLKNKYREGKIVVTEKISDNEWLTDTLTVKQYSDGISLSRNELDFSEEGGTEVLQMMSSLAGVDFNITDNTDKSGWLKVDLQGTALSVRVSSNDGTPRSATVILSAPSRDGKGIATTTLKVTQRALFELSKESIHLPASDAVDFLVVNTALPNVKATSNKSWLKLYTVDPKCFELNASDHYGSRPREAIVTVTVSDETREVEKNITVIQQNLEVIKPYVSAEEQEVLMRFEGEVREFEVYSNMSSIDVDFEDTEKSKWCSANIKDTEDGFVLEVIASANYSETSRDCWIVLKVSDGDQESTERIHVIQDPFRRNIQYDGISVCVRWGGTLHDDFFTDKQVTTRTFPPIVYGVYGYGSEPSVEPIFTSVMTLPDPRGNSLGNWAARFQKRDGLIYGTFSWDYDGFEGIKFSVLGAPCKSGGPLQPGSYTTSYWYGDAAICIDGEYIASYERWTSKQIGEDEYERVYDYELPKEINVYLHIVGSSTILPWGHPDRE